MRAARPWQMGRILLQGLVLMMLWVPVSQAEDAPHQPTVQDVADRFLQELGAAMTQAMSTGGPTEAITVCAERAPDIAGRLSRAYGWKVTRVGTRVRNPLLGMPDAWEQAVLAEFAARAANGESFSSMSHHETVTEPGGQSLRYMKPIVVQPPCLLCHGPQETIPAAVRRVLQEQYPFDAATGYRAGELRGAVSIKQPLLADHP